MGLLRSSWLAFGGLVLLLAIKPLVAGPIEALPSRSWTSANGTQLHARLAFYSDEKTPPADASVLLVPADLSRMPVVVRQSSLSEHDRHYIKSVHARNHTGNDWAKLTEKPLTYADGEEVPAKFVYYTSHSRAAGFRPKKDKFVFLIGLKSLSDESVERLTKAYAIIPPLETPLTTLFPLNLTASAPPRLELKNVPMVKQDGSYCVPASATMIANFHGLNINQKQLAHLSSEGSRKHQGTWSGDMINAMESLGFLSETQLWGDFGLDESFARFEREVMPFIRASLQQSGPLYVSFKPDVYGGGGHGCVIVGYNDHGRGKIHIHNPWGHRETLDLRDFSRKACEVVRFHPQERSRGDSTALEKEIVSALHRMPADLTDAMDLLRAGGLNPSLRLHGRRDRRDDRFEMERWALAQGHRFVASTLRHHSACLVPVTRDERIVGWYLLRLDGDNPVPLSRPRGIKGWGESGRPSLDSLFKTWATPVNLPRSPSWDMPLIEIDART